MRVLICGVGRIGKSFVKYFTSQESEVFVIDQSQKVIDNLNKSFAVQSCVGDASSPDILFSFGVRVFDVILAVVHDENANLVISKLSAMIFPEAKRIVRIGNKRSTELHSIYKEMSVDVQFFPEKQIAEFLYSKILKFATFYYDKFRLIVDKEQHDNTVSLGVVKNDRLILSRRKVVNYDYLISIALNEGKAVCKDPVLIVGGGKVGVILAKMLLALDCKVSIVEHNHDVAQELALLLQGVNVVCGNPLDQDILVESGLNSNSIVVSVTDSDQVNLIVLLLAHRIGCKNFFGTLAIHSAYVDIAPVAECGGMYKTSDIITAAVMTSDKSAYMQKLQVVKGLNIFSIDITSDEVLRFVNKSNFTRIALIRDMQVLLDKKIKLKVGDCELVITEGCKSSS